MVLGDKTKQILQCVPDSRIEAHLFFCIEQRWHSSQVNISQVNEESFNVTVINGMNCPKVPLKKGQVVGISFQYEHGRSRDRFIFDSTVISIPKNRLDGVITLSIPEEIEIIRNKSFLSCDVPFGMNVEVEIWQKKLQGGYAESPTAHVLQGWSGRLIEVSADALCLAVSSSQGPDLKNGDYVGWRFVPFHNESPITADANIKNIISADKGQEILLYLKLIGLEASPEGRMMLRRLCNTVSRYRRMAEPQPAKPVPADVPAITIKS